MAERPHHPAPKPHATRALFTRYLAVGAGASAVGLGLVAVGSPALGVPLLGLGALLGGLGAWGRSAGHATQRLNTSYIAIGQRRYAEAEAQIAEAEGASRASAVRRVAALQRGIIAMRRADVTGAIEALGASIAVRPGLLTRANEEVHEAYARAMRAFLRASQGDSEGATADARAVAESPGASGEALGFAALAQVVLLERSGDRDALRLHLASQAGLLLEATGARERAIVRAYQRMARAGISSVYRVGAPREPEAAALEEPTLADWVGKVLPAAAPFVHAERAVSRVAEPPAAEAPPSPAAVLAVAAAREAATPSRRGAPSAGRVGLLWLLIIVLSLAVWQLLAPDGSGAEDLAVPAHEPAISFGDLGALFPVLLLSLVAGVLWRQSAAARRDGRKLVQASALQASGRIDDAVAVLSPLTSARQDMTAATARLMLASIAQRRGRIAEALAHADQGLGRLSTPTMRAASADQLWPGLIEERAVALAALDRHEEASVELGSLAEPYPFIARARLRVRLLQLVRTGQVEQAARVAARWERDQLLSRRDELLVDVLGAAVTPETVGAGEVSRIKEELRAYPEGRRWLEIVAPSLLPMLDAAGGDPAPRVSGDTSEAASPAAETDAHAEAEREILAEEELAGDGAAAPPRRR